jgi:hypothetical protein
MLLRSRQFFFNNQPKEIIVMSILDTASERALQVKISNLNAQLVSKKTARIKKTKELISQAGSKDDVLSLIAIRLGFPIKVIARVSEREDYAFLLKIGDKGCAFFLGDDRIHPGTVYPTLTLSLYPEVKWMFGPYIVSYDWIFLHNRRLLLDVCKKEGVRKVFLWSRKKEFRRMKIGHLTLIDTYQHQKDNLSCCFSPKALERIRENPSLIDIVRFDSTELHSGTEKTVNSFFYHHHSD